MRGRFISRTLFFFLFLTLSLAGSVDRVSADENPPPWVDVLDCQSYPQAYAGLQYCMTKDGAAHVVVVDLAAEAIRIEYVIAEGYDENGYFGECKDVNIPDNSTGPGCYASRVDYYPVMSLKDAVQRTRNPAFVINSDYGAGDHGKPGEHRGHGPEGFTVIRGERIDGLKYNDIDNGAEDRPWLAIGQDTPLRVELDQYEPGEDNKEAADWIYTGVGGGPWLIRNGVEEDISGPCKGEYSGSCRKDAAQTAVALSPDGRWLFFVILKTTSENLPEVFPVLKALKVKDAIKLDGGGSSQLYYGGLAGEAIEAKFLLPENKRKLSQYLAIYALPGSGIDLDGTSTPPETGTDLSWWEKIQKSWNDFWTGIGDRVINWWEDQQKKLAEGWDACWAEQQKKLADWFDAWWQEQERKIAEWWEQQLVEWLNQLCGSASLVPITLTAVWITRRQKRHRL
jgi:hypothetical protein